MIKRGEGWDYTRVMKRREVYKSDEEGVRRVYKSDDKPPVLMLQQPVNPEFGSAYYGLLAHTVRRKHTHIHTNMYIDNIMYIYTHTHTEIICQV